MLAENSSDVVYPTGIDGVIQWVSPSMQTELGWRPDDLLGRPSDQLIANEDAAAKLGTLLDFVCRDERKSAIEVRFKTSRRRTSLDVGARAGDARQRRRSGWLRRRAQRLPVGRSSLAERSEPFRRAVGCS